MELRRADLRQHGYGAVNYATRPKSSSDIDAFTGQVYYTGAMATATWTGGAGTWSVGGTNWSGTKWKFTRAYAWENKETSRDFRRRPAERSPSAEPSSPTA